MIEYDNLSDFYEELDSKYKIINGELENATYTNVESNFVFSNNFARHRWFNYKEGFSPILVERIFKENNLNDSSIVCDPFCGAGTTLTVAQKMGIKAYGFEVNPFAAFISRVKTTNYDESDITVFKELLSKLKGIDFTLAQEKIDNEYICRIFDEAMLQVQLCIRNFILNCNNNKPQDLLRFAWLCTLESCSLYRKAGNGLKKKKNPPVYMTNAVDFAINKIEEKVNSILDDFNQDDNGVTPSIIDDSATNISKYISDEKLDLVLFSPPYANCFDYTKIYYLELWFGGFVDSVAEQKVIRMNSIRSHCHATWPSRYESFHLSELNEGILPLLSKQELWTKRIPDMLNGYFADMEEVLKQIYHSLKIGGACSIVVSNSAYAGIIIPTDIFLAMIAEKIGFKVKEIEVERLIITSSQQYKKTEHIRKYLRESIVKIERCR